MSSTSTVARRALVASKWNSGINIDTLTERDISKALNGLRTASNILNTSGRPRAAALKLIENLESGSGNVSRGVDWEECARLESAINNQSRKGFLNTSFTDFVDKATGRKDMKKIHPKTALRERLRRDKLLSTSATWSSAAPTETRHLDHEDILVKQEDHRENERESSEYQGPDASEMPGKPSADEMEESDDESSWEGCSAVGDDADGMLEATSAPTRSSEIPGRLSVEPVVSARGRATRWTSGIDLGNLGLTEQEISSLKQGLYKASNFLHGGRGPQQTASTLLENLETRPHTVSEGIAWDDFLQFRYALKYHGEKSLAYKSVSTFYDKLKEHDKALKREEKEKDTHQQRRLQPGSTYGSQRGDRKRGQKGSSTNHAMSSSPDLSQTRTSMNLGHEFEHSSDAAEELAVSWSREECDSLLQKMKEYIKTAVKSVPVRLEENLEKMMTTGSGDLLNNIEWGHYVNWRNSANNTKSQLLKDIVHGLDSQLVKPTSTAPKPRFPRQLRSLIPAPAEPRSSSRLDNYFDPLWERGITLESLGLGQSEVMSTTHRLDQFTLEDKPDSQRRITATSLITNLFLHPENITHGIAGEDYRALLEEPGVFQGPLSELRDRVRGVLSGSCYCQSGHGLPPSPADSHIVPWRSPADSDMMDVGEVPALPWGVVDSTRPWDGTGPTRPRGIYD